MKLKSRAKGPSAPFIIITAVLMVGLLVLGVALGQRFLQEKAEAALRELARGTQKKVEIEDGSTELGFTGAEPGEAKPRIDFETLQQANPDIVAWLTIPGTRVDYPVLHPSEGEDEDYYLRRDYQGEDDRHGSLYIRGCDAADFSGRCILVYGHNMKDGSMLAALTRMQMSPDTFPQIIKIATPEGEKTGVLLACYEEEPDLLMEKYNGLRGAQDILDYLNSFEGARPALIKLKNGVVNGDYGLLTLSTCTDGGKRRLLAQYAIPRHMSTVDKTNAGPSQAE